MKIFKKVSAIVASALMVGMSMGVAAAVNYPVPFVQGGASDVGIIVGSGSAPSDGIEAGAISLNLNSYATGTSGGSTTVSGSGGDFKVLSNSARTLYYGDALNAALSGGLTNTDLPTLLAQGTFNDLAGIQYTYAQTLKLGTANTTFSFSWFFRALLICTTNEREFAIYLSSSVFNKSSVPPDNSFNSRNFSESIMSI